MNWSCALAGGASVRRDRSVAARAENRTRGLIIDHLEVRGRVYGQFVGWKQGEQHPWHHEWQQRRENTRFHDARKQHTRGGERRHDPERTADEQRLALP